MKYMTPQEFQSEGFLQEANRLFFHPLGLALALETDKDLDEDGYMKVQVWDDRDDPEGWFFAEGTATEEKAEKVNELFQSKRDLRVKLLDQDEFFGDGLQDIGQLPKENNE